MSGAQLHQSALSRGHQEIASCQSLNAGAVSDAGFGNQLPGLAAEDNNGAAHGGSGGDQVVFRMGHHAGDVVAEGGLGFRVKAIFPELPIFYARQQRRSLVERALVLVGNIDFAFGADFCI